MSMPIRPNATLVPEFVYTQQALPVDKPIVQYIRQSTTKQLKRNKQSYELQDTDLRYKLVHGYGYPDSDKAIIKIDIDQGKSGTKRRDQRTGLEHLYELIENDSVGAVAAFDVSRLYRVLSRAEYGAFCDLVLAKGIPIITDARIYWPTRVDNDQLADDFKAAAMFIEEIIKGKLIAAKNRNIQHNFSYGGHSIPFGYVVLGQGSDSSERKFYTIYEPHAELIRWLFRRFRELQGSVPALTRELEQISFSFPPFTDDVIARVSLPVDVDGNYPLRNRQAVIGILTNKAYIGWYQYGGVLVSKEAHKPIVAMDDFMWAYERLSSVSLDGSQEVERKERAHNYGGDSALLDGVIYSHHAMKQARKVYVIDGKYTARTHHNGFPQNELVVNVADIDTAFAMAMVDTLANLEREHDLHTTVYEQVKALKQEQKVTASKYGKSIARVDLAISNAEMAQHVSKELGDIQGYTDNTKELVQLRKDRIELVAKRDTASVEVEQLEECNDLIGQAIRDWQALGIGKQQRLVRMLGTSVNMVEIAHHFIGLQVTLQLPIARNLFVFIYRANGARTFWNSEEDKLLADMFPIASKEDVMRALPTHSWVSICYRGYEKLGIRRTASKTDTLTHTDLRLMLTTGACVDKPVWGTQLPDTYGYAPGLLWGAHPGR